MKNQKKIFCAFTFLPYFLAFVLVFTFSSIFHPVHCMENSPVIVKQIFFLGKEGPFRVFRALDGKYALCSDLELYKGKFLFFSKTGVNPCLLLGDHLLNGVQAKQFLGLTPHINFDPNFFEIKQIELSSLKGLTTPYLNTLSQIYSKPELFSDTVDLSQFKNFKTGSRSFMSQVYSNPKVLPSPINPSDFL
jgi:hypothetical protein